MGKGTRRARRGAAGARSGAKPHPALVGALVVAVALIGAQLSGFNVRQWQWAAGDGPRQPSSPAALPSDFERFKAFVAMEARKETVTAAEEEWLYTKALEFDLASAKMTAAVVSNAIGAHQLACWAANQHGRSERALELCYRIAELLPKVADDELRKTLYGNILSRHFVPHEDYVKEEALPVLEKLLKAAHSIGDYDSLSAMFTDRSRALLHYQGIDAAIESLSECFEIAKSDPHLKVTNCRHGRGLLLLWKGDIAAALDNYLAAHDEKLEQFRALPSGRECRATQHRLALETTTDAERQSAPHVTIYSTSQALDERLAQLPPMPCTEQAWPWFLLSPLEEERPASNYTSLRQVGASDEGAWELAEWQDSVQDQIFCVQDDTKRLQLYEMEDVYVHGIFKTVSTADCNVIQPGFAYCSSFSRPHTDTASLRVEEVEEAVMLPAMERNYFHMTVEGSQQLLFPQLFEVIGGRRLPIILSPQEISANVCRILGMPVEALVAYDHVATAYHVKKLYYSDWVYPEVPADAEKRHHTEEYYVPPQSHLRLLRSELMKNVRLVSLERCVVVLNRTAGYGGHAREILQFDAFVEAVRASAARRGLPVYIHTGSLQLEQQISMMHAAALVIGSHGAGLTNVLYCQPGAALLELPSFPRKPSVYSMLSSALGLDVWTLPSADAYRFGSYHMNPTNLRHLRFTVDYILHSKGYHALAGEADWPRWQ